MQEKIEIQTAITSTMTIAQKSESITKHKRAPLSDKQKGYANGSKTARNGYQKGHLLIHQEAMTISKVTIKAI